MKKLLSGPVIINAVLFQIVWFCCVIGGAKGVLWPAAVSCIVLALWQLHPKRRHATDFMLVGAAIVLGLIVDSTWTYVGFMDFKTHWPSKAIAPIWMLLLWFGFALTLNHSLSWLNKHPLLPAIMGLIGGPMSYLAGLKLGAVSYLDNTLVISVCLALAWAISMTILVKLAQSGTATREDAWSV